MLSLDVHVHNLIDRTFISVSTHLLYLFFPSSKLIKDNYPFILFSCSSQVRRALKPLPDALRFSDIIVAIEKSSNERSAKEAKITLYSIIRCADEDTTRKIKQVVDRVADKVKCKVSYFILSGELKAY